MAVLLGFYHLLLEREKMHHFKRFYLLLSLVLSLVIPFVSLPVSQGALSETILLSPVMIDMTAKFGRVDTNSLIFILGGIYTFAVLMLAVRFAVNISAFISKVRLGTIVYCKEARLVLLEEDVVPHSFLLYIYLSKKEYDDHAIERELYIHELEHVRQRHTLDIIFIEILKIIFWFNPLLYYYKRAIQLNHEFLADEKVICTFKEISYYQNLLLNRASGARGLHLASSFNYLLTKKRFIMMTKKTLRFAELTRQIAVIPVIGMLLLISCSYEGDKTAHPETSVVSAENKAIQFPQYPGGIDQFYSYISKDFKIPETDHNLHVKTNVSFVVEEDGSVSEITLSEEPEYEIGNELKRLLTASKWEPALKDGKPVKAVLHLPFTLNIS